MIWSRDAGGGGGPVIGTGVAVSPPSSHSVVAFTDGARRATNAYGVKVHAYVQVRCFAPAGVPPESLMIASGLVLIGSAPLTVHAMSGRTGTPSTATVTR